MASVIRKMVHRVDGPAVDDILQDTLVKVLLNRSKLASLRSEKAWVATLARSAALDHLKPVYRRRKKEIAVDVEATAEESTALDALEAARDRAQLKEAVEALEPSDRELLDVVLTTKSRAEAAALIGAPTPTVRRRISEICGALLDRVSRRQRGRKP
jgi:RNA polymerase sigma factor (sigma-70 family)